MDIERRRRPEQRERGAPGGKLSEPIDRSNERKKRRSSWNGREDYTALAHRSSLRFLLLLVLLRFVLGRARSRRALFLFDPSGRPRNNRHDPNSSFLRPEGRDFWAGTRPTVVTSGSGRRRMQSLFGFNKICTDDVRLRLAASVRLSAEVAAARFGDNRRPPWYRYRFSVNCWTVRGRAVCRQTLRWAWLLQWPAGRPRRPIPTPSDWVAPPCRKADLVRGRTPTFRNLDGGLVMKTSTATSFSNPRFCRCRPCHRKKGSAQVVGSWREFKKQGGRGDVGGTLLDSE